jgi:hypothetical protein
MDEQLEIQKQHREWQEKYAYYVIGITIAAIGFSINLTLNQSLKISQIPLGIAILFWGMSAFLGLRFITTLIGFLYVRNGFLNIIQGIDPISGSHPEKIKIGIEVLTKIMEDHSKKAARKATWQMNCFFIGIFFFVAWRVLEMYLLTK